MASRNEYRFHVNQSPKVATARAQVCAMYRDMRRHSPEMARRLFCRMRAAELVISSQLIDKLYDTPSSNQVGGLSALVR